ncbi:MAG: stage sporulation protein [Pyrinomonadaceae bacterium]|nr:stage sporulation protein [Pyrinomonadaceae bacterium]
MLIPRFKPAKFIALCVAFALLAQSFALGQTDATQTTRPRRVGTDAPTATPPTAITTTPTAQPSRNSFPTRESFPTRDEFAVKRLDAEPDIRIGLSTSARSVTISTSGQTLSVLQMQPGETNAPAALAVSRVRIEPRMLTPLPAPRTADEGGLFRVEIAAVTSEAQAAEIAREVRESTGETPEVVRDATAATWRVRVGLPALRAEAEELRTRLEEAGVAAVSLVAMQPPAVGSQETAARPSSNARQSAATQTSNQTTRIPNQTTRTPGQTTRATNQTTVARTGANSNGVANARQAPSGSPVTKGNGIRLASHSSFFATRGLVVYAGGTSPLLDSRAPLTFAPTDASAPVRFNEKPYRGRLEVFTNLNGSLTVVNVLSLEDYVRGVVPNELSPGGYGALEALKAQAVAARTYAVSNRGQFNAAGFDLLPTIRSQVYGGLSTEHPLSTRAVEETRGLVATYRGEPINALYTSTCGGRTEHAENIFDGEAVPYLRGRECSAHLAHASLAQTLIQTAREPGTLRSAEHAASAREAALLAVHGFRLAPRLSDEWLAAAVSAEEVRALLEVVARLARRATPAVVNNDATRPPGFSTALMLTLDGESRADVLLAADDINYLLAFRDAEDIPAQSRADVAMLLRDGHLALYPDATLRPRQSMSRARAMHTVVRLLEARGLLALQKATARPPVGGALVVRAGKAPERALALATDAYLFRAFGEALFQSRTLKVVGGEPVTYHTDARGAVDYLEVYAPPKGASAERVSPYTTWTTTLSANEVAGRLARRTGRIGTLVDLRVVARGVSRRALDLEITGTNGTAHVRGGRIRSALGLREQLFVIDRKYDEAGRVASFVFTGRGWGHGVGMCQVGAYGMARAGLSYEQILKNYYTGIELTKMY